MEIERFASAKKTTETKYMTKSTIVFIIGLTGLALLLGYGKYVWLPKYQYQLEMINAVASPSPLVVPSANAESATAAALTVKVNQLLSQLSDRQKIAQLFAIPLSNLSASHSAVTRSYLLSEPGFVQLGLVATQSGVLTAGLASLNTSTLSANLPLLEVRQVMTASGSALMATSSANLASQAIQIWQHGGDVVILSKVIQPSQFSNLVTQFALRYQQDATFKQLIDRKLLEVIKLKIAYH